MTQTTDHSDADNMDHTPSETALFSEKEARVIACLMEKEQTVPDNYPLTLNSLVLACNQKSNRDPMMNLTEGDVGHIARTLADRNFVKIEYGERAQRINHRMGQELDLDKAQQALLAVMMLRGPQTANELRTRTSRMTEFQDLDDLLLNLELLNEGNCKTMLHLPRGANQREDRYMHLLCGDPDPEVFAAKALPSRSQQRDDILESLTEKISDLEKRIERLERRGSEENER